MKKQAQLQSEKKNLRDEETSLTERMSRQQSRARKAKKNSNQIDQ
jgi:hypothetical protein